MRKLAVLLIGFCFVTLMGCQTFKTAKSKFHTWRMNKKTQQQEKTEEDRQANSEWKRVP